MRLNDVAVERAGSRPALLNESVVVVVVVAVTSEVAAADLVDNLGRNTCDQCPHILGLRLSWRP